MVLVSSCVRCPRGFGHGAEESLCSSVVRLCLVSRGGNVFTPLIWELFVFPSGTWCKLKVHRCACGEQGTPEGCAEESALSLAACRCIFGAGLFPTSLAVQTGSRNRAGSVLLAGGEAGPCLTRGGFSSQLPSLRWEKGSTLGRWYRGQAAGSARLAQSRAQQEV